MAKIEFIHESEGDSSNSVERIEVRVWGPGGKTHQQFLVGSGANFHAIGTLILEFIYYVNDVQFFYTRNYLQFEGNAEDARKVAERLEEYERGEVDRIGFGDMLPETFIILEREKDSYEDENGQEQLSENYKLEIGIDTGAILGNTSPGTRMLNLKFEIYRPDDGIRFMRELIHEVIDAYCGRHPNPADLPDGASDWTFVRQLNEKAYDIISQEYEEQYFANPLLVEMFDGWLAKLPAGGHILDAGCGHGQPVIARLLEKGFQVTGTDLSRKMLERARTQFPGVHFVNQMVSDMRCKAEYDGACSFSSMLYLDPIDLSHSIYRLYQAIKPGGLLFLHAIDLHPGWRGQPYGLDIEQWMWSWSHGMDEVTQTLEEFGYFKVLDARNVTPEKKKEERIESWKKHEQEEYDKFVVSMPPEMRINIPALNLSREPNVCYDYAIAAYRTE